MSLHALAHHMAAQGRGPDTTLVHMSPREVHGLQALAMANGGTLTINPQTGLPEAGFLDSLLPAIAGFALNTFAPGLGEAVGGIFGLGGAAGTGIAVGGATALASGDLSKGLMAGLGAYGGAGLGGSLLSAGDAAMAGPPVSASQLPQAAAAQAAAPASTFERLQAGANIAANAPTDFMKSNLMNLGFAAAPAVSGAFDEQPTSSASKIHPGYIRVFKTDPVTGRSYQTEAVRADEWGGRPAIEWGGVPPVQRYDTGGTTTDETKKGVPVWGGVGEAELPVTTPEYQALSDSEKAQRYLMGQGPNPFLFYHKPPTVDPIKKAAEATTEIAKKVEEQQRGGGGGGRTSFEPGAGLAQFGGSGFTGATTNEYGDSGPTTGAASFGNKAAAFLGNLGLTGLSDAIAKNVDTNYGHEGRLANARAMANAANESQAETARLYMQNQQAMQAQQAQQAAVQNAINNTDFSGMDRGSTSNAPSTPATQAVQNAINNTDFSGMDRGSYRDNGGGNENGGRYGRDPSGEAHDSHDARGGFLNHGRFDQRYAYGGGITALAGGGYNLGSYSDGGRLLRGPGDGVSDDIPATIGQNQPARLADGEFVVPARIVSELGNGSTEAGARKLYAMMDRVQKARTKTVGKDRVAANTRAEKYLPA